MLWNPKISLWSAFYGDPIFEMQEVYRSPDARSRIHLGLFRSRSDQHVCLKFVSRGRISRSSAGIAVEVDAFSDFATFLDRAATILDRNAGEVRIPLISRIILMIIEGFRNSSDLATYKRSSTPRDVTRLYSFVNRRNNVRILLENTRSSHFAVFDPEALIVIRDAINKALDAEQDIAPNDR